MPSEHIRRVHRYQGVPQVVSSQIVYKFQEFLRLVETHKWLQMKLVQSVVRVLLMHLDRCVVGRRAKYRFHFLVGNHSRLVHPSDESEVTTVCLPR